MYPGSFRNRAKETERLSLNAMFAQRKHLQVPITKNKLIIPMHLAEYVSEILVSDL
jgi:hypothetical protein